MEIRILGAHNSESITNSCVTFIVDGTLAVEAGGLTSRLSIEEQQKLDGVLLTHHHFDHIRDIPALALNFCHFNATLDVYATPLVSDVIKAHLLNSVMYPEFQDIPAGRPVLSFQDIEPYALQWVDGHSILPVPVRHAEKSVGYLISDREGKSVFYTGDTGPELAECWNHINPRLLIVEVTFNNDHEEFALRTGHMTPNLLKKELITLREMKGSLPRVLTIHMDAIMEPVIRQELAEVAAELGADITVARENMRVNVN
jgi:ribonuclease BN (tRNA processing enzyme)